MNPSQMPQRRPRWMRDSFPLKEPETVQEAREHINLTKVRDQHSFLIRMALRKE